MNSSLNTARTFMASIFLTLLLLFSSTNSVAASLACSALFSTHTPEFSRSDVLSTFLKEDPGFNLSKRFTLLSRSTITGGVKEYYTSETGHSEINKIVWTRDYSNPNSNLVGKLIYSMAGSPHTLQQTFAGATFSKKDFSKLQLNSTYSPGYFFSTSQKMSVAQKFLAGFGNQHSSDSHVKIGFEIIGRSGSDLTKNSEYNEAEVLYPPDAKFLVKKIKYMGKNPKGFDFFVVQLTEQFMDPPKAKFNPGVATKKDMLRMQSRPTFERETADGNIDTLSIYPKAGKESFARAVRFVSAAAENKLPLSIEMFKRIHSIALKDHFFEGYYRRRIRQKYLNKEINYEQALSELKNVELKKDATNDQLPGKFRSEDVDNFVMTGLEISETGERYFNKEDLFTLSTNPFFKIDPASVKVISSDSKKLETTHSEKIAADVLFLPASKIESTVDVLIKQAKINLEKTQSDYDYVMTVLKLQQNLISIHPFQDGNGRAIKLLSDFLFLKRGLAPPLHANNQDYTLSLNELYRQTVSEMNAYVKME